MNNTLKLIKVFLASPGDVDAERKVARKVQDELNKILMDNLNVTINIYGWEDTLPGKGRPQSIINKELDECELFIGMIWKRWGSSPVTDGTYTSGFEEEYFRAIKNNTENGMQISMYFRTFDAKELDDAGPQLSKVINFKNSLISSKEILFKEYESPEEFENLLRNKLLSYALQKVGSERKVVNDARSHNKAPTVEHLTMVKSDKFFLSQIESMYKEPLQYNLDEVARVRLAFNSKFFSQNDNLELGIHDSNILNLKSNNYFFDESLSLFKIGLANMPSEVFPVWRWYKDVSRKDKEILVKLCVDEDSQVAEGAFMCWIMLGENIIYRENNKSKSLILSWFARGSASNTMKAALLYLEKYGVNEDLSYLNQCQENIPPELVVHYEQTRLNILYRYSKKESVKCLFNASLIYDITLIEKILNAKVFLDNETLIKGLSGKLWQVRTFSIIELKSKGFDLSGHLDLLISDVHPDVRYEALKCKISLGYQCTLDEAGAILISKKDNQDNKGLFNYGGVSNGDGKLNFEIYKFNLDKGRSEAELDFLSDESNLFLIPEKFIVKYYYYYSRNKFELVDFLNDNFKVVFEKISIRLSYLNLENAFDLNSYLSNSSVFDFVKNQCVEYAVDLIVLNDDLSQIDLVRRLCEKEKFAITYETLNYIKKHGDFDDVNYLVVSEYNYNLQVSNILRKSIDKESWEWALASCICKLSDDNYLELFSLNIKSDLLIKLIFLGKTKFFDVMNDEQIQNLLKSNVDGVRRAICMKIIYSCKKVRVNSIFEEYLKNTYIFYNVVYWFDFFRFVPSKVVKSRLKELMGPSAY